MTDTEEVGVWTRVSVLLDLGRSREALGELGRGLASTPEDAALWRVMSLVQTSLGEHQGALESARRAAALEPDSSEAQRTLGVTLWNTQVLNRPLGLLWLSRLRAGGGVAAPALAALHESLRLDPHDAETHVTLAGMWLDLGELKRAETHLKVALEQQPNSAEARLGLAKLALRRKRPVQAEQHAKEVLAQEPQSVRALEVLARAHLRLRQPDQAFRSALAAVKLDPANSYTQMQFTALLDEYLPQPAAQTLMFDVAVVGVRNAYRRTKLSPEVRAQLGQVRRTDLPVTKRPLVRLAIFGAVALVMVVSLRVPRATFQRAETVFFVTLYAGLVIWIIWTVVRRRRSRS